MHEYIVIMLAATANVKREALNGKLNAHCILWPVVKVVLAYTVDC